MALLVLVVDRDDDVGVKGGIDTPVLGREGVLKAAESLLLADPEDSDGNTLFAAVKIYDEFVSKGMDAEVALVSGDPHLGLVADLKIRRQLEEIFSRGDFDGIVFVSDGAEDDQVIPIVSSFAPIVSKRTVIVKQAQQLERTLYTIKTALEDPSFSRTLLGVPGIMLLLWFLFQENALRAMVGVLGIYLIIKGFGVEEPLLSTLKTLLTFDPRSPSFPFQLISFAALLGGTFLALHTFLNGGLVYESIRLEGAVALLSLLTFLVGKTTEAVFRRQTYRVGDYILFGATALSFFLVGDALLNFLEGRGNPSLALIVGLAVVTIYYVSATLAAWIRESPLFSKKIVGATVYDRFGAKIGRVKGVSEGFLVIEKGKRRVKVQLSRVRIRESRVVVI